MRRQPEITEKTRQTFIDIFCILYREKPIEKITVQEIAKRSGYNRSTFYQYFTDIYQLLEFIESDVLSYAKNMALTYVPFKLEDTTLIHQVAQLYNEKGNYLSALLGDYGSVRFLDKIKKEMLPDVGAVIWSNNDNPLLPYIQEFYFSAMLGIFRYWYRNNKNISSEKLVSLVYTLFSEGTSSKYQIWK